MNEFRVEQKEVIKDVERKSTFFMSNSLNELFSALSKAQSEFPSIQKNRTAKVRMKTGGEFTYKYADLADVFEAILPITSKHGLVITQLISGGELITILGHSSGQYIGSSFPLKDFEKIQETGSEITYVRRYSSCAIVGVHGEEDDDGAAANDAKSAEKQTDQQPQPNGNVAPQRQGFISRQQRSGFIK